MPYVVVHTGTSDSAAAGEGLARLKPLAEKAGVVLLVETSGGMADTRKLVDLLDSFASDSLGACWNMLDTWFEGKESAQDTITNLGAYVRHVRLTDASPEEGTPYASYELLGEGKLPLQEMIDALRSVNYDGFVSLRWDPAWAEGCDDLEMILTHFQVIMSRYERQGRKKHLYYNQAGTGQYVWKKDTVIECTFPQVLDRMAEEFPDQYCFKYTTLDYTRTYSQFRDDVDQFARSLIALGVKAGDKVAVWATNVPAWYITFWAATKIGAVLVTVNTAYKIHEAEYLLRQSDTHTLVMEGAYRDSNYAAIMAELVPRSWPPPARQAPSLQAPALSAQHHHRGLPPGGVPHLGGGPGPGGKDLPPGGPPPGRRRGHPRRGQYAVHLRHYRLSQGRHAHPLQRGQ